MFPQPSQFRPERFLEITDPRLVDFDMCFGIGRRRCPGMNLAKASIFINIAR
jgi:cytochrome P450